MGDNQLMRIASFIRWMELLTHATKAEQIDETQLQGEKKLQRANSA